METVAAARRGENLRRLFEPRSVAILGASEIATKPGGRPIVYLSQAGFSGRVYPINPRHDELFGYRCFPSLAALPEVPDLVVVAIPAKAVLDAVRESAAIGAGAMVIYSSGFAELGPEGAAMEREIRAIAQESGLVICGPNCQGVTNLWSGLAVNFSTALSEGQPRPGPVAIVSQSGLVGALATAECMTRGLGIGYLVSTGNEAGFEFSDAVLYLAEDERVRVIIGYLEGIRDIGRFRRAAEHARAKGKPLLILKVGRSPQAARVAATHTGAMAVPSRLYEALSEELGIVSLASVEEMIDATVAFARLAQAPRGNRVAVMGNSGGFAVMCADDVARFGLALAPLAPATIATLARYVPPYIVPQNPVDLVSVPMDDPPAAGRVLECLAGDDATDILLCCFGAVRRSVAPLANAVVAFARASPKPVLVAWLASAAEGLRILEEGEVPVFTDTSRAVRAIKTLVEVRTRTLPAPASRCLSETVLSALRETCENALARGRSTLGEADALPLLAHAGMRVPRLQRAASPEEAAAAFASFAGPVAVKLDCDAVLHKSEIGGVRLDLRSAEACAQASREVLDNAAREAPDARPRGVLVAQMMAEGVEVMIGIERDPILGPFVAVGLGGIFVEAMGDVAFHAAPVDRLAARALLRRLKAFPLLEGARGSAPADIDALAEAIAIVSEIAAGVPQIAEMDLNPVILAAAGKGLAVVDAVIRLRQA